MAHVRVFLSSKNKKKCNPPSSLQQIYSEEKNFRKFFFFFFISDVIEQKDKRKSIKMSKKKRTEVFKMIGKIISYTNWKSRQQCLTPLPGFLYKQNIISRESTRNQAGEKVSPHNLASLPVLPNNL